MEINILNDWGKWASTAPTPQLKDALQNIEKTLRTFFGDDFFTAKSNSAQSIKNDNWIHQLLATRDFSSALALLEIHDLIKYAHRIDKENTIVLKLKSLFRNVRQLHDMFSELYVYRLLDLNNIPNDKKSKKGMQELEGICNINGDEFLFEVKKLHSVLADFIDSILYLLRFVSGELMNLQGGDGFIGAISLIKNFPQAKDEVYNLFRKQIKDYKRKGEITPDNHLSEYRKLILKKYDEQEFANLQNSCPPFDIVFAFSKSKPPIVEVKAAMGEEAIHEKLKNIIEDKRKQHAPSKDMKRIFFFDNEIYKGFKFPLLPPGYEINEIKIMEMLNSKVSEDIVCIINRSYIENLPKTQIKVFCKNSLTDAKLILENLKTNFAYSFE